MTDEQIAKGLTKAQRALVLESEPGGWGLDDEGCGVEIRGSQYLSAAKLARLGLGTYTNGSPYGDLYFNNRRGLAVRAILQEQSNG